MSTGVYSCVADRHPRFAMEVIRWVASLVHAAGVDPADLVVHHVDEADPTLVRWLTEQGVSSRTIEAFAAGHPHCNKIGQLASLAEAGVAGTVVLTDCDVTVVTDVRPLGAGPTRPAGKVVDLPNPPAEIVSAIAAAAGVAIDDWRATDLQPDAQTPAANFNGGVYLVDATDVEVLHERWEHWARWSIDHVELYDRYRINIDQLSFALAIADLGWEPVALDRSCNHPLHKPEALAGVEREPLVVHYHDRLTSAGLVQGSGHPLVDSAISRANQAIERTFRLGGFVNEAFWNSRYALDPGLGSGLGSRNELRDLKASLLQEFVDTVGATTMIDLGCGDIEATRELRIDHFVGVDTSREALAVASAKRPDWTFATSVPIERGRPTDLVTCLDVLIHQPDRASYRAVLTAAIEATDDWLIVSGYERPPEITSAIVFFHEPLAESLLDLAPEAGIIELTSYRDVTMLAVRPRCDPRAHPRHVSPAVLNAGARRCVATTSLIEQIALAERTIGFFPDHLPRVLEYPWIAATATRLLEPGATVLDVGAGVSPIPLHLDAIGFEVTTVDPSTIDRAGQDIATWNEWGYLDYGTISPRVRSFNTTMDELAETMTFDMIYSVSVIEHLTAATRRALLVEAHRRLLPGGHLLLTVDITSGSPQLWNMNAGEIVDTTEPHGTFCDLLEEIRSAGFELLDVGAERDLGLHVELGWIVARR